MIKRSLPRGALAWKRGGVWVRSCPLPSLTPGQGREGTGGSCAHAAAAVADHPPPPPPAHLPHLQFDFIMENHLTSKKTSDVTKYYYLNLINKDSSLRSSSSGSDQH
jgi:hypothetical protein